MKLSSHLFRLVLFAVLPVLLFAGAMIYLNLRQEIARHQSLLASAAASMSHAIDREMLASIRTLDALGSSEHLDHGDLPSFHAQARRVLAAMGTWDAIVLIDPNGQQLANTRAPVGTKLPSAADPAMIERMVRRQAPEVSDLVIGSTSKVHMVAIGVPVVRAGKTRYLLTASATPQFLTQVVAQEQLGPEYLSIVVDRNDIHLTRTRDNENMVGMPAAKGLFAGSRETQSGFFETVASDGVPITASYYRSPLTGWSTAVGLSSTALRGSLHRSLGYAITGGILLLGLGLSISGSGSV